MTTINITEEIKTFTLLRRGWIKQEDGLYKNSNFKELLYTNLNNAFDYEVGTNNNFTFCNGKLIDC